MTRLLRWVPMAALAVLALPLFLARLTDVSSVGDEVIYRRAGAGYLQGQWDLNNEHPPLAKLIIGVSHTLFGGDLHADRVLVAALGYLTGAVLALTTWTLTRRVLPTTVTAFVWWALPLSLGEFRLHVSRLALLEGPLVFFLSCVLLTVVLAARTGRTRWWLVAGVATGLATACKLTGVVAVPAVLVAALTVGTRGRAVRLIGASAACAAAAYLLAYLPMGTHAPSAAAYAVTFQLEHAAEGHSQVVAGQQYDRAPWWTLWWGQWRYLGWPAFVAMWGTAACGAWFARRDRGSWPVTVLLAASVLVLLASPVKLVHYHPVWLPGLAVLAGLGVAGLLRQRRVVTTVLALLALLALGVRSGQYVVQFTTQGPDPQTRGARLLQDRLEPGDVVTVRGWAPTFRELLPGQQVRGGVPGDSPPDAVVVSEYVQLRDPSPRLQAWREGPGAEYEVHRLEGGVTVYLAPGK